MDIHQIESERTHILSDILIKSKEGEAITHIAPGEAYFDANFVEINDDTMFGCIFRAAEQGNMEAQFKLGDLYALGYGSVKSFSDAYKWYTKAAIQGYKKALIRIHNLYQQDLKMYCRGQLNSDEKEWNDDYFKEKNNIRELYEYRIEQNESILNGAIDYYTRQFNYYKSSNKNDPINQLNIAFLYQHGYGVKKYIKWAIEYYTFAAEQGNRDAQYNLGVLYQKHTNIKFSYRHAFKWYTKSAQGGNIAAQRCLAYFYLKGLATGINFEMAVSWYTKAATAGDSGAQLILGKLYRKGDYVKQDLSTAVKWYTLAARQGNIVAQNCLAQLYQRSMINNAELEEDISEYVTDGSMEKRLCTKLLLDIARVRNSPEFKQLNKIARKASMGDGFAMYEIGLKYYHGDKDFTQDVDTGIKWIKNAANAKYKKAQKRIADLYKEGDSLEQDYYKASIWYKTLAKQKDDSAQYNVGFMYDNGFGVRKDPLEASKWFIWGADQGNSDAQFNFGILRCSGRGIQEDKEDAIKWLRKSVHQRNIKACSTLGFFYFYGVMGLTKNVQGGLKLMEYSATNGHINAQQDLGNIYKRGDDIQQDMAKCIKYYTMAANLGSAEAQYQLAIIYFHGEGTDRDYSKAYSLLKQSKDNNYVYASYLFQTPITNDCNLKDYSRVADMFTEVSGKGINDLSYRIGSLYERGVIDYYGEQYFSLNYTKAEELYLHASKEGDSRADYRLGIMYEFGKGVERNLKTAIYYYEKAIAGLNCDAMYRLACIYMDGYGIQQDLLESFCLFTKASISGHEKASNVLAIFKKDKRIIVKPDCNPYLEDPKIPIRKKNAINMLETATEKGYAQLQYNLGLMYENDNNNLKAFKWLNIAADVGITDSYYRVGVFYEEGRCVERNYKMAATMYQKATENDHEDACYRLGQLYQYGNGVDQDYSKAYGFYHRAAEMKHDAALKVLDITLKNEDSFTMHKYIAGHGNVEMQFKIGLAYEKDYPNPNYLEAYKWYSMAASNSHMEGIYHLGLLYEQGLGITQDYHEANKLYNQACQLGSDGALHKLGISYRYGRGVEADPIKAIRYYTLSAKSGNPIYQSEVGRLYEEGEIVPKNILEALKWYTKAYIQGYDCIRPKLLTIYEDKPYETFFWKKLYQILQKTYRDSFKLRKNISLSAKINMNNRLGRMYYFGHGTKKDLGQAWKYFIANQPPGYNMLGDTSLIDTFIFLQYDGLNSSEKNQILKEFEDDQALINQLNMEQLYALGIIYYNGIVKTKDIALKNLKKGFTPIDDQDLNDPSQYIIVQKDYGKAFNYMKRAADKKHTKSLLQLAIMCHCGHGTDKNSEQGDMYFDLVANSDIDLMADIGVLYHTHKEIQNFSKAFNWYTRVKKALNRNSNITDYVRKQSNRKILSGLGLLYEYGDNVQQDYQKALEYYKKLSEEGDAIGLHHLGLIYYHGKGVPVDYKKALDLFQKVSLHNYLGDNEIPFVYSQSCLCSGDSQKNLVYCSKLEFELQAEAHYYLGIMYKNGQGTLKDEEMAQYSFEKSLRRECKCAQNEIED